MKDGRLLDGYAVLAIQVSLEVFVIDRQKAGVLGTGRIHQSDGLGRSFLCKGDRLGGAELEGPLGVADAIGEGQASKRRGCVVVIDKLSNQRRGARFGIFLADGDEAEQGFVGRGDGEGGVLIGVAGDFRQGEILPKETELECFHGRGGKPDGAGGRAGWWCMHRHLVQLPRRGARQGLRGACDAEAVAL